MTEDEQIASFNFDIETAGKEAHWKRGSCSKRIFYAIMKIKRKSETMAVIEVKCPKCEKSNVIKYGLTKIGTQNIITKIVKRFFF